MKELDSFTVERLEEIRNSFLDRIQESAPSLEEVFALINIALAAKRAEPVAYADRKAFENFQNGTATKEWMWAAPDSGLTSLYTTPQLNSPEIPEGWKLVPNMPTLGMLSVLGLTGSFESMLGRYADMLYAAPEAL